MDWHVLEDVQVGSVSGRYAGDLVGTSTTCGLLGSIWPSSLSRQCPLPLHSLRASFRTAHLLERMILAERGNALLGYPLESLWLVTPRQLGVIAGPWQQNVQI